MSEITLRHEKHLQKNGDIRKAKKEGKKWNHSEEELGIDEGVRKEEEEKKKRIEKLFKREIGGGGGGGGRSTWNSWGSHNKHRQEENH